MDASASPLMRSGWHLTVISAVAGIASLACTSESPSGDKTVNAGIRAAFSDRFEVVDRIVPEQTEEHPVARIAQVVFSESGDFLIVDDSEANVKLYDQDGSLRLVIGRKGEGPGEFLQPRRAAIGLDGKIHVLDQSLNRLQVFGPSGDLLRNVPLEHLAGMRDFGLLSDGRSYVFLDAGLQKDDVLFHTDSLGGIRSSFLPISHIVPVGEKDGSEWVFPRTFFLDVEADTAFVIASVRNTLWKVDLSSGSVSETTVAFDGYIRPLLWSTSDNVTTGPEAIEWFLGRHLTGFIRVDRGEVLWPFIQGELMRGDPMLLLHQTRTGSWEVLDESVPILVDMTDGHVAAIENPAMDNMELVVYGPK